jgi:rubrerythrin
LTKHLEKHDPASLASFLKCLSILEVSTFHLYKVLSDRVESPLLKSMLFGVASDSEKHAALLKGIADSIVPKAEVKAKECERRIGETLRLAVTLAKEITDKEEISEADLYQLIEKLDALESTAGEEYSVFVQLKTLEVLSGEINRLYKIDLKSIRGIFVKIINDEEHHREIIASVKELLRERRQVEVLADPLLDYRELINSA